MADLIRITGDIVRITFDHERKLKCRHKYIRDATRASGKSVQELVTDHFGGHAYLVQALLAPGVAAGKGISLDDASDLIDVYLEKGGTADDLAQALMRAVASYLHIELTPAEDETEGEGLVPNAASPAAPGTD